MLQRAGLNEGNYSPAMYKIYWKLGFRLAPPHFLAFWANALISGVPLGLCATGLYIMSHSETTLVPIEIFLLSTLTTIAWGSTVAAYYRISRIKHHLPDWNSV